MNKQNTLIAVLCVLLAVCIFITIWALFFRERPSPISPDYYPQDTDENQWPIEGGETDKLESPDGGGAINITYSTKITVDLSEGSVTLMYANPHVSNQNVAIFVMMGDLIIAKSDLILPGYAVTYLELDAYAAERLSVGGYDAEIVVKAYDPKSGEKAMLDAHGVVTVTVVE